MPKKRKPHEEEALTGPTPEPEGPLKRAGRGIVGGISAVANIIDIPRSIIDDTQAAITTGRWSKYNPLDQLLTPHRSDNRITGRDLNRLQGLAGRKDTWANWGGGLAREIATDPLTYLTFGGSALGKLGRVAKAAGVHGDTAAGIYSRAMGKAPGAFGKRQARLGLTGDMIKKHDPASWLKMESVAKRQGSDLNSMMGESLGGMARFWPAGSVLGTGKTAQKMAGFMDDLGTAIRDWKIPGTDVRPVGDVANLFNQRAMNATSRGMFQHAAKLTDAKEAARVAPRLQAAKAMKALKAQGYARDDARREISNWFEYPDSTPAEFRPFVDEMHATWAISKKKAHEVGASWYGDIEERMHFARQRPRVSTAKKLKAIPDADLRKHDLEIDDWLQKNPTHQLFGDLSARSQAVKAELGARGTAAYQPLGLFDQMVMKVASKGQSRKYMPTRATEGIIPSGGDILGAVRSHSAHDPFSVGRKPFTLGAEQGTNTIRDIAEYAQKLDENAFTPYAPGQKAKELQARFGHKTVGGTPGPNAQFGPALPANPPKQTLVKTGSLPDKYLTGKQFHALKQHIESTPELKMLGLEPTVNTAKYLSKNLGLKKIGRVSMRPKETWRSLAKWMDKMSPELKKTGIYGNYPLTDILAQGISQGQAVQSAELFGDYIAENAKHGLFSAADGVKMGSVLKKLKMRAGDQAGGAAKRFYDLTGGPKLDTLSPEDAAKAIQDFQNLKISKEHAKFLLHAHEKWDSPEAAKGLMGIVDKWTNFSKMLFTTADFIKFNTRNVPGGMFNSATVEQLSGDGVKAAYDLATKGEIAGAKDLPIVQQIWKERTSGIRPGVEVQWLVNGSNQFPVPRKVVDVSPDGKFAFVEGSNTGLPIEQLTNTKPIQGVLNDKAASDILAELAFATETTGHAGTGLVPHSPHVGGSANDILSEIPGERPFSMKGLGQTLKGKPGAWNPTKGDFWKFRGVTADETVNPWVKTGEQVGDFSEHMIRFSAFYTLLKQGVDPGEAARMVGEAQARYQGRFYTKTEQQVMQRLFLFYKFFRGQMPFLMKNLMEQPGGRTAQILRGINRSRDEDDNIPDWIKETASFPAGTAEDGTKRWITGFGLPFEDPIQFASPSAQNLLLEGASRLNPLFKGPLEYMTGQSFFQKGGPHGGRPLDDLDPPLGRTIANIGNITGIRESKDPVRFFGSRPIEHLLANSPLSSALTKARTLTDPRKSIPAKASNLLSGLKLTDVSPAAQDRELRNRVQRIERQLGARQFTETYLPKEIRAKMSPAEAAQTAQLAALKKLLDERSKKRRVEK